MTAVVTDDRAELATDVALLRERLEAHVTGGARSLDTAPRSAALVRLGTLFGLSAFERAVVLLCAAVELDSQAGELVAAVQDGEPRPTFGLAFAVLPSPHWDALAPGSPLRRWQLVEPANGTTLASSPLRLDEHILHHLTGLPSVDAALTGIATRPPPGHLSPTQMDTARDAAATIAAIGAPSVLVLEGDDLDGARAVAVATAAELHHRGLAIDGESLPPPGANLATVAMRIDRDARLLSALPVIESNTGAASSALLSLLTAPAVVTIGALQRRRDSRVPILRRVGRPSPAEQRAVWSAALGERAASVADTIDEVAHHHRLSATAVHGIATEIAARGDVDADVVHQLCRQHGRQSLDDLADRIEPTATWDDLVLPAGQAALVRSIVRQLRHRTTVYERWGFASAGGRGLGITALFAGESGTGKTLAAEVIAGAVGVDLYRVDLSATVSKYIGETEKNLRRLFDAAETGGAVLLFDEADALFGKRTEVKDSHDRYANLEVAYLLQRMESYRGLAILTTNLRSNVDRAFTRRLRFIVQFPFPGERERAAIWRRCLPPTAPTCGLDPDRLAVLNIAGGTIRAIALGAAFAAADAGDEITIAHVLAAAEVEYAKAERTLTTTERAALS